MGDNRLGRAAILVACLVAAAGPAPGRAAASSTAVRYRVVVHTGNRALGGTDANVSVNLVGELGESGKVGLPAARSEMEIGDVNGYLVTVPADLGPLTSIRIGHDNSGRGPGWFLESVEVSQVGSNLVRTFPCHRWLATDEDDRRIERTLDATPAGPAPAPAGPRCAFFKQEGVSPPGGGAFQLVSMKNTIWPNDSTLKIHFLNGSDALKREVAAVAAEWLQYINLKFEFYYDPAKPPLSNESQRDADIAIQFWDQHEGYSYYGSSSRDLARKGELSMMLPSSSSRSVTLHEFGHALGLAHEHLSPNAKILWNKPAVYAYYKKNFGWDEKKVDGNLFTPLDGTSINFSDFDSKSIMLYQIPASFTTNGIEFPGNFELSDADKEGIARIYPPGLRCPNCSGLGLNMFEFETITLPGGRQILLPKPTQCPRCNGSGRL